MSADLGTAMKMFFMPIREFRTGISGDNFAFLLVWLSGDTSLKVVGSIAILQLGYQ